MQARGFDTVKVSPLKNPRRLSIFFGSKTVGRCDRAETSMRDHGRNIRAFRSNHLKKPNHLPQDRFSDLERAESLARLERLAEVRPSVVARGKALIANPQYPDKKIIRSISSLLTGKL